MVRYVWVAVVQVDVLVRGSVLRQADDGVVASRRRSELELTHTARERRVYRHLTAQHRTHSQQQQQQQQQ